MELSLIIPVAAGCIALACLAFLLYLRFMRTTGSFRDLMGSEEYTSAMAGLRERMRVEISSKGFSRLFDSSRKKRARSLPRRRCSKQGSSLRARKMILSGYRF